MAKRRRSSRKSVTRTKTRSTLKSGARKVCTCKTVRRKK